MLMIDLVGMMLVDGPSRSPLRALWPLHRVLADLNRAATETDLADSLPAFSFKPDAIVGLIDEAAVIALHELVARNVVRVVGEGWDAALEVSDHTRLRPYRRMLLTLQPRLADLIYRAATNWAALALTAEKNWVRDLESVARRRASATPKRRHGPDAAVRWSATAI
jgi:hypothetical protein